MLLLGGGGGRIVGLHTIEIPEAAIHFFGALRDNKVGNRFVDDIDVFSVAALGPVCFIVRFAHTFLQDGTDVYTTVSLERC